MIKALSPVTVALAVDAAFQYCLEAVGRIFSPDDNSYPAVGVQPYEGEPYSRWLSS